jgi:hypothetical protein
MSGRARRGICPRVSASVLMSKTRRPATSACRAPENKASSGNHTPASPPEPSGNQTRKGLKMTWQNPLGCEKVTCNQLRNSSWRRHRSQGLPVQSPPKVKVREHRERLRRQGLRPIQIWVPDVRAPAFRSAAHCQSLAVAASSHAHYDQAFVDSVSVFTDDVDGDE